MLTHRHLLQQEGGRESLMQSPHLSHDHICYLMQSLYQHKSTGQAVRSHSNFILENDNDEFRTKSIPGEGKGQLPP